MYDFKKRALKLLADILAEEKKQTALLEGKGKAPGRPASVRVKFGAVTSIQQGENAMASGTTGVFSTPNVDMVPYDVEILDANGDVLSDSPTGVLALVSNTPNAIVVPNSTDPTGATGNVVAAKGFSGNVGGTASYNDPAATPPVSLSGTWTGNFTAGQPFSVQVNFGTPSAPAAGGTATAAAKSAAAKKA
jgi:hypothetical protein